MRDVALALFIFGMVPFMLVRPYIGLLVWSWLGYMNPNRLTFGFAYSFPWVQLVAIVTMVGIVFSGDRKRIPISTVSVLLFLFIAWAGVTTIFAVESAFALQKFMEFLKIMVMVFVTLMLVSSRQRMHWLIWMIVLSLGFYGVKGGLFTVLHGGHYHVMGPRASFIADNNALALALSMILPLMRYLQLRSSKKWMRVGLAAAMLLTGVAILGTYSRGGLVALVIVAGALFLKSRRRMAMVLAVVVVGFVAWHFMPAKWTERMDTLHHAATVNSAQTRIESWEFAANVAFHRPLRGGGFEIYRSDYMWQNYAPPGARQRAIHSIYFRVLGEQGFVGLALFLALLYASWRKCRQVRKQARDNEELTWAFDLASMLQVSLVAFMVAGAFLPMPYFDLTYQLMAVAGLLGGQVMETIMSRSDAAEPSADAGLPDARIKLDTMA